MLQPISLTVVITRKHCRQQKCGVIFLEDSLFFFIQFGALVERTVQLIFSFFFNIGMNASDLDVFFY